VVFSVQGPRRISTTCWDANPWKGFQMWMPASGDISLNTNLIEHIFIDQITELRVGLMASMSSGAVHVLRTFSSGEDAVQARSELIQQLEQ
jgi:hypothetical protein